jgi:hypothetical protein
MGVKALVLLILLERLDEFNSSDVLKVLVEYQHSANTVLLEQELEDP